MLQEIDRQSFLNKAPATSAKHSYCYTSTARLMRRYLGVDLLAGLGLALVGAWLLWGPLSALVVAGGALFAFGLASID
jgi:hypothetical protein